MGQRDFTRFGFKVWFWRISNIAQSLQWRHNGVDGVSNHQPHDCLLYRLFSGNQRKYQSSASLAFAGNSLETGEFPAQMASNAENVSIWWRHHNIAQPCRFNDHNQIVYTPCESKLQNRVNGSILTRKSPSDYMSRESISTRMLGVI